MEINVDFKYFKLIQTGQKTREGRCATERYTTLKPGDAIIFVSTSEGSDNESGNGSPLKLPAKVLSSHKYGTFRDMLINEGLENCLPGITSLDKGVEIYRSFPGYAEKEAEFGVIAIRFNLDEL